MAKTLSRLDILLADGGGALHEFVGLVKQGEPIPEELLDYAASVFQRQLSGENFDTALDQKRGRGRPPASLAERDRQTATVIRVLELVDSGACGSDAEAKDVIAGETGLDVRTIEGYMARDGVFARYLLGVKQRYESLIARAGSRK